MGRGRIFLVLKADMYPACLSTVLFIWFSQYSSTVTLVDRVGITIVSISVATSCILRLIFSLCLFSTEDATCMVKLVGNYLKGPKDLTQIKRKKSHLVMC